MLYAVIGRSAGATSTVLELAISAESVRCSTSAILPLLKDPIEIPAFHDGRLTAATSRRIGR